MRHLAQAVGALATLSQVFKSLIEQMHEDSDQGSAVKVMTAGLNASPG
jgi:hypothetical protein